MKLKELRMEMGRLVQIYSLNVDGCNVECTLKALKGYGCFDVKWIDEHCIYVTEEPHSGDCYYKATIAISTIGTMTYETWGNMESPDEAVKDLLVIFDRNIHKGLYIRIENMFGRCYLYDSKDIEDLKNGKKSL